ncbi:hypothetical protein POM88_027805 [Heracleum sosnowskyi]|uniref:Uncharacterized protein n=1 Tax=Heracleum sosnowskyi TaxID=360622 RepID=A0AAD8MPV8_9APIA|nr:hypothetical protein POM88_027805 [Heracleum sosnowskyi]
MIKPFRNWLGMSATILAWIQSGSIDRVPFLTVVPCLGASLALREKTRQRKPGSVGPSVPRQHLEVHILVVLHGTRDIPHSMAPSAHQFRPLVQTRRPFSLSSIALSFLPAIHAGKSSYVCSTSVGGAIGRSTLWQDQSLGQTNPPPKRIVLCPSDPYRTKELHGDPLVAARSIVNSSRLCRRF